MLSVVGLSWFLIWGHRLRAGGFVLGFLLLVVLPLLAPLTIKLLCGRVRPAGFGIALSLKNLATRLQTTSFAVAALAVTVAMLVSVTFLIGSFRQTLVAWLEVTMRADIYISTESWTRGGSEAYLSPELVTALAARPWVRAVEERRPSVGARSC